MTQNVIEIFSSFKIPIIMARVSRGYRQGSEAKKVAFGYTVYQTMSSKAIFKNFKPQLEKLKANLDGYQAASVEAALGGIDRILTKNNWVKAIVEDLDVLAANVELLAISDESVIAESGFQIIKIVKSKGDAPATELDTPVGFKVVNIDKSGSVKCTCNTLSNATLYSIAYFVDDKEGWVHEEYTNAPNLTVDANKPKEYVINNLPVGKNIKFKTRGISETGVLSDWSYIVELWIS